MDIHRIAPTLSKPSPLGLIACDGEGCEDGIVTIPKADYTSMKDYFDNGIEVECPTCEGSGRLRCSFPGCNEFAVGLNDENESGCVDCLCGPFELARMDDGFLGTSTRPGAECSTGRVAIEAGSAARGVAAGSRR